MGFKNKSKEIENDFLKEREKMIDKQIIARNIKNQKVIEIMKMIPRHIFVRKEDVKKAYEDYPLPIGEGQTISQPYMVALMTECLELVNTDRTLEIGTGSGYQTSLLAKLSNEVYTIERFLVLIENAKKILDSFGIINIHYKVGDGTKGWDEYAPFDKIIVTAGAPEVPELLLKQLKDEGILVIPIGNTSIQRLTVFKKINGNIESKEVCGCTFVPLIGEFGWKN